jgi:hypothetical protein
VAVIYNKHAYITKKDEKTWNTSTNLVSFGQLVVEKTDVKSLDSDVSCKMNSLVKNKPNLYHKGIEINMHTTPQYILNY